ncbi:RNA-binding S4 domain-containing protein [candidate division KSB1 bacterium]|nr:MAG: RNA-binding S4 domain-containing protein [candidate division KSB1 bacterium]
MLSIHLKANKMKSSTEDNTIQKIRLDKWLKTTRLARTRSQAEKLCEARRVKVNGHTVKPSKLIHIGDTITIRYKTRNRSFEVLGITHKSIAAEEARQLYAEHLPKLSEESAKLLEVYLRQDRLTRRQRKNKGRPTKKERRQLEKLRGW